MRKVKNWALATALVALTSAAQAALVSQGNGTVLDNTTHLIWLQDWNANGLQSWGNQKAWAEGLSFAGSSDWVLPSISDYATLFAEVGSLPGVSQFTNVMPANYWSSTEIVAGSSARNINPFNGNQHNDSEDFVFAAVAVRSADVAATVPAPQTLALALLALGAALVAGRRRAD